MEQDSQSVMVTWERASLKDQTFLPNLGSTVKTIFLQHYLIVFNLYSSSEQIVAFDLKEKQWLKVKLTGEYLGPNEGSSICVYDTHTMIMFGTDGKEDFLSLLSFSRDLDEIQIHRRLTHLQKRLLKSYHSANIFDDQMYLYGGYMNNAVNGELSMVDLETLKVTAELISSGQAPGPLYQHSSLSQTNKIYIYGGYRNLNSEGPNDSIYLLERETLKWTLILNCPEISRAVQIHENNVYIFGGNQSPNNYLSIYNTSKKVQYEVAIQGDLPPACYDCFSAVYENKMFVFGGLVHDLYTSRSTRNLEQVFLLNFNLKPVKGFIKQMVLERALGFEENKKDLKALEEVNKLLDENKDPDILFKVQNKEFPAHKSVLSLRSDFFSNMFSSGMQESYNKEIVISDVSAQAFEVLIEYFYKDILPSDQEILKELILYSEKILLKRLRLHCERTLINKISKGNAAELYELSKTSGAEDLREAALQFMGNNLSHFADKFASVSAKQQSE